MKAPTLLLLIAVICMVHLTQGAFKAGVSKVDGTLPIGVPLAGYNWGPRRVPNWPIPQFTNYTTWMMPSQGVWNPTWVKVLVISNGDEEFAFVTMDVIGADSALEKLAWNIAKSRGFSIPYEKCLFLASHSHSGPGALTAAFLWSAAPATDMLVPEVQQLFAQSVADALLEAEANMVDAVIDIGTGQLTGVTENRRADISPDLDPDTVDTNLGVIRVDTTKGEPLATIWNYAIHGTCWEADNMKFSSDIMGSVSDYLESTVGGVAMFMNSDAGDANPVESVCENGPNFSGGPIIGSAVQSIRDQLKPTDQVQMKTASQIIDFGPTSLNLTLARVENCTQGGPLDICSICMVLNCVEDLHLGPAWVATQPPFTALSFVINDVSTVVVSIPGEALTELGYEIRSDTAELKFDQTLLAGYAQDHLGYFCTEDEYDIGGYESLLTFWGVDTAEIVRGGCKTVASRVTV